MMVLAGLSGWRMVRSTENTAGPDSICGHGGLNCLCLGGDF